MNAFEGFRDRHFVVSDYCGRFLPSLSEHLTQLLPLPTWSFVTIKDPLPGSNCKQADGPGQP